MMYEINVKSKGAVGDGQTKDTKAIQSAIDLCHEQGGGRVLLEGGCFVAGTLYLKSNVYLYLASSAILQASPNIADYSEDTHYNRYVNEKELDRCFIYACDAHNIGIIGEGRIDGNAEHFPNIGSIYRPMMIRFLRCSDIHVRGVKLWNAAAWTTAFLDSDHIWIDGLDIYNDKRFNGDGLDFDGCRDVFVSNCKIVGTDDNLCLQASSKSYPVKNIHVSNCSFTSICAGIRIGLKSIGDIFSVTVSNCTFENIWREGIKIECTEGGNISDIMLSNLTMHNVRRPFFIILNNRLEDIGSSVTLKEMPQIGTLERIQISQVSIADDEFMRETQYRFDHDVMGSPRFNGIRVDAAKDHPIRCLAVRDVFYRAIGGVCKSQIPQDYPEVLDKRIYPEAVVSENYYPDWSRVACMDIRNVDGLSLEGLVLETIDKDERPKYLLEGCTKTVHIE